MIDNPKCEEVSGCGSWSRPLKRNPDYKGKWYPPMIDNPEYKGIWAPRKIPNPHFFEDPHPAKLNPIIGIALDIWTMDRRVAFDDILLTDDEGVAAAHAEKTWRVKFDRQAEVEEESMAKDREQQWRIRWREGGFLDKLTVMWERLSTFTQENVIISVVFLAVALTVVLVVCTVGRPTEPMRDELSDDEDEEEEEEGEEEDQEEEGETAKGDDVEPEEMPSAEDKSEKSKPRRRRQKE